MRELSISADNLVRALLNLPPGQQVCLLDSCGVSNLGSRYLIAGFDAVEILEISGKDADRTLEIMDAKLSQKNLACISTISYEFGLKLNQINPRPKKFSTFTEPDFFLALFDCLIVHDYDTKKTFLSGDQKRFAEIEKILRESLKNLSEDLIANTEKSLATSNFTREKYLETVETIKEFIRRGDTYQTNLTQQFRARLPENLTPEQIFLRLRKHYPAPFAAFLRRNNDVVVSASPERFFRVQSPKSQIPNPKSRIETGRIISASPIKGTRRRGKDSEEDLRLQNELLNSEKDRAENVMIVDLLRNDIGRVCKYGSVTVEKLCDLETHPTLFHLVSTVCGTLREDAKLSDILKAVFPCGSITGAPKIRTMQIIDELETAPRGLSMGAIGYVGFDKTIDFSVAIRTMVVRGSEAIFNVGGGIVIDSNSGDEYAETLTKAKALLDSINADFNSRL